MTGRNGKIRAAAGLFALLCLPLAGCGEDLGAAVDGADQAIDQAQGAMDKAGACSEALGITADFNPEVPDPQQLQAEAGEKANRLQELGNQVADANLRESLLAMADGYVEIEQAKADQLANMNDWIRKQSENLENLRQICL
ncbi:hypothetical protein [Amycolatopsis aidingensis]|uniref:hypothetical protein n=1 Tax=Amycolatopsis aidingensis TaxID=2842453 RepID=UPI001C0C62EF|nr:hypothetical protein [Amycolatopsis aidingensis]